MGPKMAVRVGWPPELVLKLLQAISEDSVALQTYFPISSTQALGKLKQSKKFCALFFKNDNYMIEIARLGYAKRDLDEDDWNIEEWLKIDSKDTVYDKVVLLKRHFRSGKFKEDNGIRDEWRSFDDVPNRRKRDELLDKIPYYFLLKKLCNPDEDPSHSHPLILTQTPASTNTIRSKRRQRSLSVISISSLGSASSGSDAPSSPVRPPKSKRVRRTVPDSSPLMDDHMGDDSRRALTPLRSITQGLSDQLISHVQSQEENTDSDDDSQDSFTESESHDPPLHCPSPACSGENSTSDVEEVQPPSILAKPSKTRRSVIKNTVPDQTSEIPDGPGRGMQDAIDVDDQQPTVYPQELIEEEKPRVTEFVDELPSNASFQEILSFVTRNGAVDQDKLRETPMEILEKEMEVGKIILELLKPDVRAGIMEKCLTNGQKNRVLGRARMELGLEAIQRTIQTGLSQAPIEGYGFEFHSIPPGDYVATLLKPLIESAGGNVESEHYQIEETVDRLLKRSRRENRAPGNGMLVFVELSFGRNLKRNLNKLAKWNGFSVAYSEKYWIGEHQVASGSERKHHLAVHVSMNPKPDRIAANGMTIKPMTPAGFCDYLEIQRSHAPKCKPFQRKSNPDRTRKQGKKRGKKVRPKSAKEWKGGATKQKNVVKRE
ncbi:uncharacterized protein L199_002078 [Kwoniella botswanensis]|uniref:uncharacterized protein n=1 Tax=Kwoniella botswanensis TaxID=1268659 RepID=UPI00315D146E